MADANRNNESEQTSEIAALKAIKRTQKNLIKCQKSEIKSLNREKEKTAKKQTDLKSLNDQITAELKDLKTKLETQNLKSAALTQENDLWIESSNLKEVNTKNLQVMANITSRVMMKQKNKLDFLNIEIEKNFGYFEKLNFDFIKEERENKIRLLEIERKIRAINPDRGKKFRFNFFVQSLII